VGVAAAPRWRDGPWLAVLEPAAQGSAVPACSAHPALFFSLACRWYMFLAVSPAATATLRHSSLNGMYTTTGITIGAIGQVQGSINWTHRHPPTWSLLGVSRDALMIGMMQIGAILGAIIAGTIADKFGRKISCAISGLCQAFGGLICLVDFFIPKASRDTTMLGYTLPFIMYFIGRFVAGVGVGMACHSVPMIVAELSPEHLRGPFDGAFQLFVCLGITTSFVLNLIILTLGEDVTNWWGSTGFLMPLGMPAISGMLMALTVYFFCPESPK
jgi:MFS family permease